MGQIAFVFSGQGAQHSGMGLDLYRNNRSSGEIFDLAEKLRPGTLAQCFGGTAEELSETVNTQPCMFAMELAAAAALTDADIRPRLAAGFSLGELAALTYAGALSFEEGFRLVCLRGQLMQEDAEKADSAMAVVLRLDAGTVERLCAEYAHVYPVNYNCPGQISVSGLRSELDDFMKSVKAAGGRALLLRVAGGFHSPLMSGASLKFKRALRGVKIRKPDITLYSNYTGLPYEEDLTALLSRQMCNPVRWEAIITHMIQNGADTFIELGPGRTLCGMIEKTDSSVRTFNVEDCATLNETVEGVKGC